MDKLVTKGPLLNDSTHMKYLVQSNSQRQNLQWQLPGTRGSGEVRLMGTEFQFGMVKKF